MPEHSLSLQARQLIHQNRFGCLSTHSRKCSGFPFGSLMPYAVDGHGAPIFFISSMAMHTQNLHFDPRASLLISQSAADPLAAPRLTLVGTARQTPAEDAATIYLAQHENARQWHDFSDFAYYRLEVSTAYLVSGFGSMGWITSDDYYGACPAI